MIDHKIWINVAKCSLGKVYLEPMLPAVTPINSLQRTLWLVYVLSHCSWSLRIICLFGWSLWIICLFSWSLRIFGCLCQESPNFLQIVVDSCCKPSGKTQCADAKGQLPAGLVPARRVVMDTSLLCLKYSWNTQAPCRLVRNQSSSSFVDDEFN